MAQKVTLSGLVVDGTMNEPMPGASVVLLQPKDSVQAAGVSSDLEGKFKLPSVKAGNYILRISFMGFQTYYRNITLPKGNKSINLGEITLQEDSKLMKEAEVTAKLAQVEMKADTFIYNAEAYRLPEGSMLEELVKKLPGAEIDDDGNVKINGKSVSKIMVDGKEYFQNDTKMALKNLPSKLIKKLKSYDKKSDYTRITGIDDGEEETVLDLSVKKGMKEGWVGNFDGAYGTEDRYSLKANVNRFLDHSYMSVIGSRNNVNDFGGRWGGGGNGITTSTMGGVTFAWENGKPDYSAGLLKMGGNVRYNSSDSESESRTNSEMFLPSGTSQFSNSKNRGTNWNQNINANFQLEWFPDSMTNIMFRPNFSHSNGNSFSNNHSVTFNRSPFEAGLTDPVEEYEQMDDQENIRVNGNQRINSGDNNNNNVNGWLQVNRRLVVPGRNLTLSVDGSYSESNSESYSRSMIRYYQRNEVNADYQNTSSPSKNYSYQGRLSYTEPILKGTVVQASYQIQYRFQDSKRKMMIYEELEDSLMKYLPYDYDRVTAMNLYNGTYRGMYFTDYGIDLTDLIEDKENSQYAKYTTYEPTITNCFFFATSNLPTNQGAQAVTDAEILPVGEPVTYNTSGITAYVNGISYGGNFYYNPDRNIKREITGYGDEDGKWAFIASPVEGSIAPTAVNNLVGDIIPETNPVHYNYDLFCLNPGENQWENYVQHTGDFNIVNGNGYLYATQTTKNLVFSGIFNTENSKTVALSEGFNLVGNPFGVNAYVSKPFYQMNAEGTDIEPIINDFNDYTPVTIPPCTGIVVRATGADEVTFSVSAPQQQNANNNGNLQMTLTKAGVRNDAFQDTAIVSFNQGSQLEKFVFNERHAKLYIPQYGEDYAIAFSDMSGEVPLNFKTNETGRYTSGFNFENVKGVRIQLIDKIEDKIIDLTYILPTAMEVARYMRKHTKFDYTWVKLTDWHKTVMDLLQPYKDMVSA